MKCVIQSFFLLLAGLLPGAWAVDSVVVFNELQYHPATNETASEWVELHNQMAIDVDLSSWELTGDIAFTFAEGTIIPGGGYLVIALDPVAVRASAGITNVAGPFAGRLNNSQGTVRLRDRNGRLMDEVEYRDGGKWPVAPDGSGATLAKGNRNTTSGPAEHWTSSVVLGGTPGNRNFPENTAPASGESQRRPLIPINGLWRFDDSGTDLGTSWRNSSFDDSAWRGRNNSTLVSYWPLDGNATASVGTDGTLVGAPTAAPDRNGNAGGALSFTGSLSQRVEIPGGGGLSGATSGTISFWVRWAGTQDADCCSTFGAVFARQANGLFSDNIIALTTANPTTARVTWRQSGAGARLITGTSVVGTAWHHLAITFSPTESTLYWDGAAQGSAAGPALSNNGSVPLSLGAWIGDGGGFSTSFLDDVAIWDQPLTALQIAQLAAQTATPLSFGAPESAVYYAGDGRLSTNDELRRTALSGGRSTYYFRGPFTFLDEPAEAALRLDLAVDDGAVFYLNGSELYRHNMPAGAISYATPAASPVGSAPLLTEVTVPASALLRGQNVLAVEVHQAGPGDAGMVFGAALNAILTPRSSVDTRILIARNDPWRFEASNTDLGTSWRSDSFSDAAWSSGAALFSAGSGEVDGVPPERLSKVSVSASSEYITDGRLATNAVSGAGLSGNSHVNTPPGTMWLNRGTNVLPHDLDPRITFDLGAMFPVRWLKVWNYNEDLPSRPELLARGVASANIMVGPTTATLTNLILGQPFNKAPGTFTDFSQLIDLGGVQTRYVRLDKLTNFPGGDFRFVGLSEVQLFRDPDLKRTTVPLGPVTYYLRRTFEFGGDPARTRLFIDAAVDDGAVFYLNGLEVRRINMPGGAVSHTTPAANPVIHATFTGTIELPTTQLRAGPNVLAVEVHQAAATGDPDMIFGATLWAEVEPPSPESFSPGPLRFNEVSAANPASLQIELINQGSAAENTLGYVVRRTGPSPDAAYTLPAHALAPGSFLVLDQTTLGFAAAPGDKLFLLRPGNLAVADSVEVHERPRSRFPDGIGEWFSQTTLFPGTGTPGSSNVVSLHDEVVFNEIFYHGLPTLAVPAEFGTNTLLSLTNIWRYEQSAVDLGTAWRQPGYNDSSWAAGRALLGVTATAPPVPKNTDLTLGPTTFYFRTTFNYSGTPAALNLNLRYVVDDGAVFYLNGVEVNRFNMTSGAIAYTNNASGPQSTITLRPAVAISLTNLLVGPNVLAVEVHQALVDGGDVAFSAELSAGSQLSTGSPYVPSTEEWVEFYNRSTHPVDLTGWRLDEGIDFRFPANTQIPPGGYLVVAKDPTSLLAKFPGIPITGPYTNRLSHRGEQLVLKDAADNVADRVFYFDDGRWPRAADAGGASLELRDPRADNTAGEAWAASDELSRSSWRTYSYRGIASASAVGPDGQWKEFVMGLHGWGEVLLDDISVIETPATTPVQLIQNGTFDTGTNKWRLIGNHHGEVIDDPDQPGNKVLRLIANGSTEHMSNHGETTLANSRDTVNGREYEISFRARWLNGSRQLHTRLYFNRLARTTLLEAPARHGTPGIRNSTFTNNIGPTYSSLQHSPVVPAAFAPTTVSVVAADPDGVAGLTLWWGVNGGAWSSTPMIPTPPDPTGAVAYTATLAGRTAGTVVQFYVQGVDSLGAISQFPASGPRSRALYKVNDGRAATNGLHNFRMVTLTADGDRLHRTVNLMSNERVDCTVIYDEKEIFYDVGLRLKGSEHSRTETLRLGFNVSFTSEQRFRGVHSTVAIDRSESTGYGQREMLIHQTLNHAGGVPTKYHDLIHVMTPRLEHTGGAELQLARYTDVFLDDQYENGSDGTVYEYELVYQLNSTDNGTPEGNKVPAPDSVVGTNLRDMGSSKEAYRWTMLIKNNEEKDDYQRIMQFCKVMPLTGTNFFAQFTNIVDLQAWFRGIAVNALSGAGDSYGGDGSAHNVQFYVRPTDQKVIYFPHDVDAFFDPNRPIVPNGDVDKLLTVPAYARAYYGAVQEIITTTYNTTYMGRWAANFGRLLPAQPFSSHLAFIGQRVSSVNGQVNAAVPNVAFAVTNNSGNPFGTTSNTITLQGTAALSVREIEINGVRYPITWITRTVWSVRVPLFNGPNDLTIQGIDFAGRPLPTAVDSITVTNSGSGAPLPVLINEWMADNASPAGYVDPFDDSFQDWFELFNPNTNAVNLSGFYLTDNLSIPNKWAVPQGTVIAPGGFLLVWADNQPEQNGLDSSGNLHAGFQLNNGGEAIGLYTAGGVAQHLVVFDEQFENVSSGLFPDGATNSVYLMTNFTPRAANTLTDQFPITGLSLEGGEVTLTWQSIPGRIYQVEFKNDLVAPSWTPIEPVVPALGSTATFTDAPVPFNRRFYRIQLLP